MDSCHEVGGELCEGTYMFGLDGTTLDISLPTCTPKSCNNTQDLEALEQCVKQKTCGSLPETVRSFFLPECDLHFSCGWEDHTLSYVFIGVFGLIGLCVVIAVAVLATAARNYNTGQTYSIDLMELATGVPSTEKGPDGKGKEESGGGGRRYY